LSKRPRKIPASEIRVGDVLVFGEGWRACATVFSVRTLGDEHVELKSENSMAGLRSSLKLLGSRELAVIQMGNNNASI